MFRLTLTDCTISGNSADIGGGIYNGGTLALTNCTVNGNTAYGEYSEGGGISNRFDGMAGDAFTTGIFALSGTPVPEHDTLILLGIGTGACIAFASRRWARSVDTPVTDMLRPRAAAGWPAG